MTINATELRASLLRVVCRVRRGKSVTVTYRGRPAFQVVPLASVRESYPLETDPLFRAPAVGGSREGRSAADHDALLYRS